MAIFKVGQRVRVVRCEFFPPFNGLEGTITRESDDCDWVVHLPGQGFAAFLVPKIGFEEWPFYAREIEPLADSPADAFIASIKAMKPYEEPKVGVKEGVVK